MGLAGSLRPRWPGQPVQWCRWTQSLVGFKGLQGFPCQETALRLLLQLSMRLLNLQPSTAEERARRECNLIVPQSVQPAIREGSIACTRWPVEDFGGAAHLHGNSTKSRPISLPQAFHQGWTKAFGKAISGQTQLPTRCLHHPCQHHHKCRRHRQSSICRSRF